MICNCKNSRCTCLLTSGFGIDVSGNGSQRNPYVVNAVPWELIGSVGENAEVVVTGSGEVGDPWVVSVDADGQTVTRTVFLNNGVWVNPGAGAMAHVICVGGGGGGNGNVNFQSPSGGGGGAVSTCWFVLADLPATVPVQVGAGGSVATSRGGSGGTSFFGEFLLASGGSGTDPNQFEYVPSAGGVAGTPPEGGYGGNGATLSTPASPMYNSMGAGGGGFGGGSPSNGAITRIAAWPAGNGGNPGQNAPVYGGGGAGGTDINEVGIAGAPGIVIVTTW